MLPAYAAAAAGVIGGLSDEDPAGIELMDFDPQAYFVPNTGLNCASNCLTDDIAGGWAITTNTQTGRYIVVENPQTPTTRGSAVSATYCWHRSSDHALISCQQPASWWKSTAYWPDRKVIINGREASNITRVSFAAYAPEPEVEVIEYQRPESPSCSMGGSTLYCNGSYKLKIVVRHAGWYSTDRVYLSVQKANGDRWGIPDNGAVASGDTLTWTWSSMPNAEPGSRLVIAYHPWEDKPEGRQEQTLPLRGDNPQLTLDATEVFVPLPAGMQRVQVAAGTPVEFEPAHTGERLQITGWTWTPSDTAVPPETVACAATEAPCVVPVLEAGTMKVTARVDGLLREATAPVGVTGPTPNTASLTCDGNDRGLEGQCAISSTGGVLQVISWRFNANPDVVIHGATGSTEWRGAVVTEGVVTVTYVLDGSTDSLKAVLSVVPRDWEWTSSDWAFTPGGAPDLSPPPPNTSTVTGGFVLGWNCSLPDCVSGWILPDVSRGQPGG